MQSERPFGLRFDSSLLEEGEIGLQGEVNLRPPSFGSDDVGFETSLMLETNVGQTAPRPGR